MKKLACLYKIQHNIHFTATCDELPPIANGSINYTSDVVPRPRGTVAIYSCDDDFFLVGNTDRNTCQETSGHASFSDQRAPICVPESGCCYKLCSHYLNVTSKDG